MTSTSRRYIDVRVNHPERHQREWREFCLDEMLAADHMARTVWAFVESLDLGPLYEQFKVTKHTAGRPGITPEVLVSLWLLGTLESISSARELNRRCTRDLAYMWICGGVSVNYHTLSDFRSQHAAFLESLLIDSVATLIDQELVSLETVAQDGMRVRANAGSSSFRRKATLEELQQQAAEHLERLKQENEDESVRQEADARKRAAQQRAARERKERIDEAIKQRDKLAERREKRKKGDGETTRCSTTDPDARRMKMANGGYDPAFNVQFATDGDARVIVGVDVTKDGTDGRQLAPMVDQLEANYGKCPDLILVDSAFATKEAVTYVETKETKVVGSIPRAGELKKKNKDPYSPQRGDSNEYKQFRNRMSEPSYQELYKLRPSIAEFPNAVCRNQGLRQFYVRGLEKVKAVTLWHALAFNFRRMLNLGVLS